MSYQLDAVVMSAAESLVDFYNPLRAENGLEPAVVNDKNLEHARHIINRLLDEGLISVPYVDD